MSTKLFVGNLDFKISEKDLTDSFASFGEIEDSFIVKDTQTNRSKGFGFITFENDEDAQKAISEMNEKELNGRKITVNVAKEKEDSHDSRHHEKREHGPQDEYAKYFSTTVMN